MILQGMMSVDPNKPTEISNTALSVTQLMIFNSLKCSSKDKKSNAMLLPGKLPCHFNSGLLIHSKTRKRDFIYSLYEHGLSASYDRVRQVSIDLANQVIAQYETEGLVCPPNMKVGLFITANLNNIDHNSTSTSAQGYFHGTALSKTGHVTSENPGMDRHVEYDSSKPKGNVENLLSVAIKKLFCIIYFMSVQKYRFSHFQ